MVHISIQKKKWVLIAFLLTKETRIYTQFLNTLSSLIMHIAFLHFHILSNSLSPFINSTKKQNCVNNQLLPPLSLRSAVLAHPSSYIKQRYVFSLNPLILRINKWVKSYLYLLGQLFLCIFWNVILV